MQANEVEITIKGTCGSGKSTIARLIAEALHRNGFSNIVHTDDASEWVWKSSKKEQGKRLKTLRERKTKISTKTQQVRRVTANVTFSEGSFQTVDRPDLPATKKSPDRPWG